VSVISLESVTSVPIRQLTLRLERATERGSMPLCGLQPDLCGLRPAIGDVVLIAGFHPRAERPATLWGPDRALFRSSLSIALAHAGDSSTRGCALKFLKLISVFIFRGSHVLFAVGVDPQGHIRAMRGRPPHLSGAPKSTSFLLTVSRPYR